jgi:3-hydroxyacyl-CoA dehydrogenase/enoyl-CoA hydratase/3-hydroxybutyryl-CoA epimerase
MSHRNDVLSAELLDDGVVVVTLKMEGRANAVNEAFLAGLADGLDWIDQQEGVTGIVLASGHRDFCVGADLNMIYAERDPARIFAATNAFHRLHRRMEKGVPVVCALSGSALGGGYELAMACHHRIAVDDARVQVGLPEVMLGLIPGGGGTQRLPRMIGAQAALEMITQGKLLRAPKAKSAGLVDALVPSADDLLPTARAWIAANPKAKQPWDSKSFRWPGVRPNSADARNLFLAASAMAYKKTAGAFPAVEAAISAVQEGSLVAFDRSLEVEGRHFAGLVVSDQAKDMVRTLFFHKQAADKQVGLPKAESHGFHKVAILGAGMMGAGLAFVCAKAGCEVVLKDISDEALQAGMAHVDKQVAKLKHLSDEERTTLRGRITGTLSVEDCRGSDLVIEAVVENLAVKHEVTKQTEPLLADGAVWASNTSAIPITDLAKASAHPERFIGLHFFSPVEKMPLLEIIRGEHTDDDTLARCLAFGKAIKKTCIVVGDGYGFYTSNVFSAYILEGACLVAEGHDPRLVEWAAKTAGMVVPPLQVFDEVTLSLGHHAITQGAEYLGSSVTDLSGVKLVFDLVEAGRKGRSSGAGFYDYDERGKRKGLFAGLRELADGEAQASVEQLANRLMLAQLAAVGRCFDAGILDEPRDAEVGAILGIGFAPNTGGPLAFADRYGMQELVDDLAALAAVHGERFEPAQKFRQMAEKGERFFDS